MAALPAAPFDACHQAPGQVSSQSLVRFQTNDYSVPVAYGYHQVWVRGYVEQVVIGCGTEVIARHRRSYEGEDTVFDPLHYLPLIERKPGALDQAAPLAGWELPDAFATLRRLMEARSGRAGRREYVQVLRLLETFGLDDVHAAVKHALRLGAIGFDAVKHLVLCRVEKRPPRLDLDLYPYLPTGQRRQDLRRELPVPDVRRCAMSESPRILLEHRLKTLKLPTFLREYEKVARQSAHEGLGPRVQFLSRLVELELIDRERRLVERRIKAAKFPTTKSLDSFEFKAIPSVNKVQFLELARCEWIERRENVIALGPSGTGKTHAALGLGLAACQQGLSVRFVTAAALVHELMEARDERRLLRLQKQLANHRLLIIDELGFVPLSKTGAELLFELVSQRYERAATLITSNLPFDEWTETFGSERLTGALLDRLTHHVHILEMNGESFRLNHSRARKMAPAG